MHIAGVVRVCTGCARPLGLLCAIHGIGRQLLGSATSSSVGTVPAEAETPAGVEHAAGRTLSILCPARPARDVP
eukprot:8895524-Pyramimonas_sp.AAC.1